MYLEQLHYLMTVDKYPSISQAATALFITQPALSRAISKLEDELDLKLLQRTSNGISLTPDGKIIAQCASNIMTEVDNIYRHASKQNRNDIIYFTTIPGLCDNLIVEALTIFSKEFPDIKLVLDFSPGEAIIRSLKNNVIDFALLSIPREEEQYQEFPENDFMDTTFLFSDTLQYWMKAEHPLADTKLTYDTACPYFYSIGTDYNQIMSMKKHTAPNNIVISNSISLYKSLIYCNDAILSLPHVLSYKDPDIAAGKIVTQPIDYPLFMDYYFIKQKNKHLSKATDEFINIFLSLLFEYQKQL